ncbi:beta-microseminoprotein [Tiliqua scincoides]|uniref:beta-microseminoprotein n=1 Tax=Tiliqua scincoides TaxID=71010 RepID=UPI003463053C
MRNVLLSLTVLSLSLAFCHGFCFRVLPKAEWIDGKFVLPDSCVDVYDQKKHPLGSTWNTDHCMTCDCTRHGMQCCTRSGGIAVAPGCEAVVDETTCEYRFHMPGDPSTPCGPSRN